MSYSTHVQALRASYDAGWQEVQDTRDPLRGISPPGSPVPPINLSVVQGEPAKAKPLRSETNVSKMQRTSVKPQASAFEEYGDGVYTHVQLPTTTVLRSTALPHRPPPIVIPRKAQPSHPRIPRRAKVLKDLCKDSRNGRAIRYENI